MKCANCNLDLKNIPEIANCNEFICNRCGLFILEKKIKNEIEYEQSNDDRGQIESYKDFECTMLDGLDL